MILSLPWCTVFPAVSRLLFFSSLHFFSSFFFSTYKSLIHVMCVRDGVCTKVSDCMCVWVCKRVFSRMLSNSFFWARWTEYILCIGQRSSSPQKPIWYKRCCVCTHRHFLAIPLNDLAISISIYCYRRILFVCALFLQFSFLRVSILDADDVLTWFVCSCHLLYMLLFFLLYSYAASSSRCCCRCHQFHTYCVAVLLVYSIFGFMCRCCMWACADDRRFFNIFFLPFFRFSFFSFCDFFFVQIIIQNALYTHTGRHNECEEKKNYFIKRKREKKCEK